MGNSRRDLRDDEIVRFCRFSITESAAATFTQVSYDTQLSIDRGFLWMIHWVEASMQASKMEDAAQDASEVLSLQVTRESKAATVRISDADCIFRYATEVSRYATIGTDAGPVVIQDNYPIIYTFPLALPYAHQEIYVAVQSSNATPVVVYGRLAYTLRKVSDKFFYRVAHAMIS